jgi:hypothetical protein
MKNFKQIAEDCLAGKLSGVFVLRNGKVFHSTTHLSTTMFHVYPYCIAKGYYSVVGNCYSGGVSVRDNDVIDFIPDNMQKHIKIDIPEGKVPVMEQTANGVVITWKEKELTYTEISDKLRNSSECIHSSLVNSSSQAFFKKVEVLRKLTNIRNYFGGDKSTNSWVITIDSALRPFVIKNPKPYRESCFIYFDTQEHAEQAIKILGDELKYLFEPW